MAINKLGTMGRLGVRKGNPLFKKIYGILLDDHEFVDLYNRKESLNPEEVALTAYDAVKQFADAFQVKLPVE